MTAVKVAIAVLVVLAAVVVLLRMRKLRRDEMRELSKPNERRLMAPPPSPYAPSKGFRLLDGDGEPLERPPVPRPRLDPERRYVFGESSAGEEFMPTHLRHDDDWFLSRSAHRSTLATWFARLAVVALVVIVLAVIVTYYLDRHHKSGAPGSTTTSTLLVTTTSTALPAEFRPSAVNGGDADYAVPLASYRVTVTGARGTTWASFAMGPARTLEWQGDVHEGAAESLTLRGDAWVTVGSPSNASVAVAGRPVAFPTPLPATLTLFFRPGSTTG